jgi:hypothetical protein
MLDAISCKSEGVKLVSKAKVDLAEKASHANSTSDSTLAACTLLRLFLPSRLQQ